MLRTPVPAAELDAPAVVTAYKNLKYVERDFRHIKSDDLDLRPVFHRLEERVRAHVLICMLACYLTWHLRRAWAPLTFTDENPPEPDNPVAPARRSAAAQAKASGQHDPAGQPYRSFRGLLEHLATLTRNQVRYTGTQVTIAMLTEPTSTQRQAFEPHRHRHPADLEVASYLIRGMVASREIQGGGSRRAGAAAAFRRGFVRRGCAGWAGWCGLPVTPGVLGMRSR